ncbi:heterokaryon incompatibility protein-domain-containing protein [Hyaloscypha finlandica]|nr:heterokaryon incompatibility protein-domain-containing protein [Hyaloscypha finlandica]
MASIPAENLPSRSTFPYRPLDELNSIRLVCLHPASSSQDEVKCSLIHSTLKIYRDIYDDYTALSYVWGDPNDTRSIWIDGIPFPTPINLFSALRDLRHENRTLLVWADAICINQIDDEEKLGQIAMMGKIYSMAEHTVIYLGPLEAKNADELNSWASADFHESRLSSGLADLVLSQTWFRRVWVFQELVFSKDPRVQLGRYRLSWNTLYHALARHMETEYSGKDIEVIHGSKLLTEMHQARETHRKGEGTGRPRRTNSPLMDLEDESSDDESSVTMFSLLRARRGLGVTYPKDMIFAHLGFASDGAALGERINYSMNHVHLYNLVARHVVDQGLHCELFNEINGVDPSSQRNGLSSWTPNWEIQRTDALIPSNNWVTEVFEWQGRDVSSLFWIKPEINNIIQHTFVRDPPILACLGAELDVVVRCSGSLSGLVELFLQDPKIALRCCLRAAKPRILRYSWGLCGLEYEDLYEIIWGPDTMNEDILSGVKPCKKIWDSLYDTTHSESSEITLNDIYWLYRVLSGITGSTHLRLRTWNAGILARTGCGRLALVPRWTQCGDIVAGLILPSGRVHNSNPLLIFRPIGATEPDLEALLTEKFGQQIRPVLHCKLLGLCCMDTDCLQFEDQNSGEYKVTRADPGFETWKAIMAGSSTNDLMRSIVRIPRRYIPNFSRQSWTRGNTKQNLYWKTFAIH